MSAVTVNSIEEVPAANHYHCMADVTIAADGDTWATGYAKIYNANANTQGASNTAVACTVSGGTITFQTAGAESNVLVSVVADL